LSSVSDLLNCQLMMKKHKSSNRMSIMGANWMAIAGGWRLENFIQVSS
jgi:hypothetical protein